MDKDIKITLSLFLTWLVFGLFNLFGQPEAFVPPVFVDGLMVVGLGIYFLFPFRVNIFYPLLLIFPLIILLLSLVELGWISISLDNMIIIAIFFFLFPIQTAIAGVFYLKKHKKIGVLLVLMSLLNVFTFFIGHFDWLSAFPYTPLLTHTLVGCLSILIIAILPDKLPETESLKKVMLLIALNFVFDIGNYLALLALV